MIDLEQEIKYVEELSLNAWPSHMIELYDGWLIRFSYNYTYRTNSVEQVGPSTIPPEDKIAYCESVYRQLGSPCNFKINPLLDPSFDRMLAERDYEVRHVTEVMTADMSRLFLLKPDAAEYEFENRLGIPSCVRYGSALRAYAEPAAGSSRQGFTAGNACPGSASGNVCPGPASGNGCPGFAAGNACPGPASGNDDGSTQGFMVQLQPVITDEWIEGLFRLNGTCEPVLRRIVPSMFKAIPKKTIAASVQIDGRMVASGLAICDREYVGIYAIYVAASCRRRHYARAVCSTLLSEAKKQGAKKAYLQVVKGNISAKSLYVSLGFQDFYTYWFRSRQI